MSVNFWKNVQEAVDNATPGDTVNLADVEGWSLNLPPLTRAIDVPPGVSIDGGAQDGR